MARRSVKPPFSNFIKNIAAETLEQQLGYVDAEKTTQLILYPEPEQIITCIQENAVCSPETLGQNLGLRPQQVNQVIEAHPGNRGLQNRRVICCWIEANQSEATVRALLDCLWHSDDTKALTCVQDLEVVQTSRRKEDRNATEEVHASVLPLGSQYNMSPPFQREDSPDHRAVVAMPNGTLTQRSLHEERSTDSATEESVQETRLSTVSTVPATYTPAVPPSFLPPPEAKPEELPSDLPFQQPHEATQSSVPLTESEIVALSESCSSKPPQPPDVKPEELPLELALQQPHEATESSLSSTETEFVAASGIRWPSQESMGEIKHKETDIEARVAVLEKKISWMAVQTDELKQKSTNSEIRIKKLEEEIQKLRSELKDKDQEIKELHQQIRELKLCVQKKDEEITAREIRIKQLEEENQKLKSELRDKQKECEELKLGGQEIDEEGGYVQNQPIEDVDALSRVQPNSKSAPGPEEDPEDANPKKWTLGKRLGRGSFGEVYTCDHKDHPTRSLAVKVIEVHVCGDKLETLNLFTKEASALKQVSKNNRIVEYIDIDVITTGAMKLYIFMEYMPGGSLRQYYTQKRGGMDLPHVQKCTVQLLEGVAHLHENKIVHRDIKGANILRDSEGNIKLADFGCAKSLENIDIDGKMSHDKGTTYWRAPETVKLQYAFESDIWSVGATVIELITGQNPYHPYEPCTVVFILGSEEPTFKTPYDVCNIQEPDPHMVTFLGRCFRREPSQRSSAQDLLQTAEFCRIAIE